MIAGRPGSQKSGFALWWAARLGLPTLYLSADMTPFEASSRLAGMYLAEPIEHVEYLLGNEEGQGKVDRALRKSKIHFAFESPITWQNLEQEIDAYVEVFNSFPGIIVVDNLMDLADAESDYTVQMQAIQMLTAMCRDTGSTVFLLHHTTDNSYVDSAMPQPRREIKNKLGEKPNAVFTVALDSETNMFRIGVVKNRNGRQDPEAKNPVLLRAQPDITRFGP